MKLQIYQVDAFADKLFSGNPAAVVIHEIELSVEIMQKIAAENNLSETAFVYKKDENYNIRWFTPTVEVDLCGHATLAAAHVFFDHLEYPNEKISFSSNRGFLDVQKKQEYLYLNFPADTVHKLEISKEIINGLGQKPLELYKGTDDFLAILENEDNIASLSPNMEILSKLPSRGIIVSAQGNDSDFVCRFFAPQAGVPEDPVTGSAYTTLIPYWSKRLRIQDLHARQISKRGGNLVCRNLELNNRVEIGGKAITYMEGEISVGSVITDQQRC
jgi:PhzF family phenazine biosynthesis protein